MFLKNKNLVVVLLGVFFAGSSVNALNTVSTGFQVSTSGAKTVDAWSTCKKVSTTGTSLFVPTKTTAEWTSFLNYNPAAASLNSCQSFPYSYPSIGYYVTGVLSDSAENNYVLTNNNYQGSSNSDIRVVKFNSSGDMVWGKTIGSAGKVDHGLNMKWVSSTEFLVLAKTASTATSTYLALAMKMDINGNVLWKKVYNFSAGSYITMSDVVIAVDGHYMIVGGYQYPGMMSEAFILKVDKTNGSSHWVRAYGRSSSQDSFSSIVKSGAYYYILGSTDIDAFGSDFDTLLLKIDALGNVLYSKKYGEEMNFYSLSQSLNGDFLLLGDAPTTSGDTVVAKMNLSNGSYYWAKKISGSAMERVPRIKTTASGNIFISIRSWTDFAGTKLVGLNGSGGLLFKKAANIQFETFSVSSATTLTGFSYFSGGILASTKRDFNGDFLEGCYTTFIPSFSFNNFSYNAPANYASSPRVTSVSTVSETATVSNLPIVSKTGICN